MVFPLLGGLIAKATAGLVGLGLSAGAAAAVVQIGGSLLISAVANALYTPKVKASDVARDLAQPTTDPAYRGVYGETRATGTPMAQAVRGSKLYTAYLLNSSPSDLLSFTLYMDKREITLTGDAFTFSGGGAVADSDLFDNLVRVWIGRGDQTQPPQRFLDDAPWASGTDEDLWLSTDRWEGRTVIWIEYSFGSLKNAQRWKSTPPQIEVEGRFAKVWDPRDETQDANDPATWEWSDNHALCVLDALRNNPIKQYGDSNLLMDCFEEAADVSDEQVSLNAGGTESRYTASGTVTYGDGELEDILNPMMVSGAADWVRVGASLGIAAGEYRAPAVSLDYFLGNGVEFTDMLDGPDLFNELRVSYTSPARGYESADLRPWPIPGALAEDGNIRSVRNLDLPFCASPTQAMRVRKIAGLRGRRQVTISGGELPPEAANLVGGATLNLSLPAPYDALDGVFEVVGLSPLQDALGESGVARRMPAKLVQHSSAPYAWDETTEEEVVRDEPYEDGENPVLPPTAFTADPSETYDLDTGGGVIPRVYLSAVPSVSASVEQYEWQSRPNGGTIWERGNDIDGELLDASSRVFDYYEGAIGQTRDFRLRAVSSLTGEVSDWVEVTGVYIGLDATGVVATAEVGQARFTGTAPTSAALDGLRIYETAGTTFDSTTPVSGVLAATSGAAFDVVTDAMSAGATNLWLVPIAKTGKLGTPDGHHAITIL